MTQTNEKTKVTNSPDSIHSKEEAYQKVIEEQMERIIDMVTIVFGYNVSEEKKSMARALINTETIKAALLTAEKRGYEKAILEETIDEEYKFQPPDKGTSYRKGILWGVFD